MAVAFQPSSGGAALNQNQSMTVLPTSHKRATEKKKRTDDSTIVAGANGRPLTQIELVGVYKFTRN